MRPSSVEVMFHILYRRKSMTDENNTLPSRKRPASAQLYDIGNRSNIVFITVCTKDRKPILASTETHESLIEAWEQADAWRVGRYIILPDHIHLFSSPASRDAVNVKRWVAYWKFLVSKKLNTLEGRTACARGHATACPSSTQPHKEGRGAPRPPSIWQRDVWDRQLRRGDSYRDKWEYVRNNPVRHGLVECAEDWPYQGELNVLMWHDA